MSVARADGGGVALPLAEPAEERLAEEESWADCEPDAVMAALAEVEKTSVRVFVGRALATAFREAE